MVNVDILDKHEADEKKWEDFYETSAVQVSINLRHFQMEFGQQEEVRGEDPQNQLICADDEIICLS